jgi:hypothetical protein
MGSLQNIILMAYSIILPLFVLLIPKGMLTTRIYMNRYKVKNMSLLGWLECYTPFRNTYIIKKAFDGNSMWLRLINTVFPTIIFLTIIVRYMFPPATNQAFILIQLLFTLLMFITIIVLYLTEIYIHLDLCNLLDRRGIKWTVIFPPLCSYLLTRQVDLHFKKHRHLIDGTFDGHTV